MRVIGSLVSLVFIAACAGGGGPEGPAGPQGPAGQPGPAGAEGAQGATGSFSGTTRGAAPVQGLGSVSSTGVSVTGTGTQFETDFAPGDAILVGPQVRIVREVVSDTEISTETSFDPAANGSAYSIQRSIARFETAEGSMAAVLDPTGAVRAPALRIGTADAGSIRANGVEAGVVQTAALQVGGRALANQVTACSYGTSGPTASGSNHHQWIASECDNGPPAGSCFGFLGAFTPCGGATNVAIMNPGETIANVTHTNGGVWWWNPAGGCNGAWVRAIYFCH